MNTLKYANRAKNIKTKVKRNVLNVNYHISKYSKIIANLKNEITDLRTRLNAGINSGPDSDGVHLPSLYNIE
jgi:kinesin family protein 18/19